MKNIFKRSSTPFIKRVLHEGTGRDALTEDALGLQIKKEKEKLDKKRRILCAVVCSVTIGMILALFCWILKS